MAESTASLLDRQRKHWNSVAGGWGVWLEWTRRNFAPLTDWFRTAAAWAPGARVLDVACGSGYPALDAALAVAPSGRVVGTDLAAEMVAVASHEAATLAADNAEFLAMDAEALQFADGAFDAVTNAYGLMFSPTPAHALREAHRVLVPGGRIGAAVWDQPARSPFFTVIRGAIAHVVPFPDPKADDPHPFRLASVDAVTSLLCDAGFTDVRVDHLSMTFDLASADEYLQLFNDVSFKSRMATLSPGEVARIREALTEAVQPYVVDGRLRLVAASLCASGRK
jgi:enediyne biosynthesis protein CalE5